MTRPVIQRGRWRRDKLGFSKVVVPLWVESRIESIDGSTDEKEWIAACCSRDHGFRIDERLCHGASGSLLRSTGTPAAAPATA
jgi:hypothetical protein